MLDERARAPYGHPHMPYRHGTSRRFRRAVPAIAVTLVIVITTDVVVISELSRRRAKSPENSQLAAAPWRLSNGYVARPTPGTPNPAQNPTQNPTRNTAQAPVRPAAQAEPVRPLGDLHAPHLFAVTRRPLTQAALSKVTALHGVRAVEVADAAEVAIDGKRVQTLGVDPSTFRAFTPRPTAKSDALWGNIAGGDAAVSFVLGNDGGLSLGRTVNAGNRTLRVGAYATMGMGSIDAVVSRPTARSLGIPQNNALVVSAPKKDTAKLRRALLRALPKGSQVATINPVLIRPKGTVQPQGQTSWPAGTLMSVAQIETALKAAVSKLGRPYVWGAEGPDTFDCSGLVQWAYAQAGVRMPRVTHQQWVTGPQIPLSQAQPGDLIFWRHDPTNPGYISHVAIYWGNGQMLQAPRTGDVVKISPVSARNLAGVVRVSPQIAARTR
ncbi:C40 family peptidase [Spongiactinospora sp. TRM90649]|uniref:C40 family peptidase n=1 Tax=Spongiactinospora sp. TRM90649 TaxID=3031114 RepID=UPI0023F641CA|nr:C40 family peptidase [Spongiactinospora sp. TRM90649]MDF5754756.1 C40 family peptidase [Spongiactinospora sp. TRM90649]